MEEDDPQPAPRPNTWSAAGEASHGQRRPRPGPYPQSPAQPYAASTEDLRGGTHHALPRARPKDPFFDRNHDRSLGSPRLVWEPPREVPRPPNSHASDQTDEFRSNPSEPMEDNHRVRGSIPITRTPAAAAGPTIDLTFTPVDETNPNQGVTQG